MLLFSTIPPSDLDTMQAIEARSNPTPWTAKNLADSYQRYHSLGAFIAGDLQAFVIYQTVLDEGEIIHIVCDRDVQGRGYARELLQHLLSRTKPQGISNWFLEVKENNQRAKKLYQNIGFVTVGGRKAYYADGQDAILMRLRYADMG